MDYFKMTNTNSSFGSGKRSLMFACLLLFCVSGNLSASAIEDYSNGASNSPRYADRSGNYEAGSFWQHWFIGASGGGLIYFADHAKQAELKDRLSYGGEGSLGKWWSPYIGTRVGFSMQKLRGMVQDLGAEGTSSVTLKDIRLPYKYGIEPYPNPKDGTTNELWEQRFDVWHAYADCLFDITNLLGGINDRRFWSIAPYAGVGWMNVMTPWYYERKDADGVYQTVMENGNPKPLKQGDKREVSANIGVLNSFRLGKMVDLVVDVRGTMVNDRIKAQWGNIRQDGILSASLGLVVHLGKNDWAPATAGMSDAELAAMNERISEMNRENAALRKSLDDASSRVDKLTEWRMIATDIYIRFDINQTVLLREARVQLGLLARMMKEYPEATYTITGYADASTGTPAINMQLSKGRAEVIKTCLVREFGIEPNRLQTEYAGGIENRYYNDPYLSRATIIRPDK